jgi:glycine/D-amino acid oxidase-like deaminating enzyme
MDKHLKVTRQTVFWADMKNPELFSLDRFPCWLAEHPETGEYFYGFPILPVEKYGQPFGLKFAQHNPGEAVNPETVNRVVSRKECDHISQIIDTFFPGSLKSILQTKVCLYTYSPDENFIIDMLPEDPRVVFAGGFSGHGFKFASVIGEILTDLAISGASRLPVDFLSYRRLR